MDMLHLETGKPDSKRLEQSILHRLRSDYPTPPCSSHAIAWQNIHHCNDWFQCSTKCHRSRHSIFMTFCVLHDPLDLLRSIAIQDLGIDRKLKSAEWWDSDPFFVLFSCQLANLLDKKQPIPFKNIEPKLASEKCMLMSFEIEAEKNRKYN